MFFCMGQKCCNFVHMMNNIKTNIARRLIASGFMIVASASLFAQSGASFSASTVDLGSVLWKKPVRAVFKVRNTGSEPLVISNVETQCSCTSADWTREAIAPGAEGEVSAVFDAALMGHFTKLLDVYYSGSKEPVTLTLQGNVVYKLSEKSDVAKSYPYKIGEISINKRILDFGDCTQGRTKTIYIELLNGGKSSYEPVLMHLPSYISVEATPARVPSGRSSVLKVTFDAKKYNSLGLVNSHVYLSRYMGDKVGTENEMTVRAAVVPDFSYMTPQSRQFASHCQLSTDSVTINMKEKKSGIKSLTSLISKAHTQQVSIVNAGRTPLEIKKVGILGNDIEISLSSQTIQPGENAELTITAVKKKRRGKKNISEVFLITTDPDNPKQIIKVCILD